MLGTFVGFSLCVVAKRRSVSLSLGIMISIVVVLVRLAGKVAELGEEWLNTNCTKFVALRGPQMSTS